MNGVSRQLTCRAIVFGLTLTAAAWARADDRLTLKPQEPWAAVFADSETTFRYAVGSDNPFDGHLSWRFSVGRGTVARGELPVKAGLGEPAGLGVTLHVPPTKEGVIVEGRLDLAVVAARGATKGTAALEAAHSRPLWIFPRDPFAGRARWLEGLHITLFDPEGDTADRFDEAKIPYEFTKNTASLEGLAEGMLVVGEGTSFRDCRDLAATIMKTTAAGVPVLCLAPADGTLPMPGAKNSQPPLPDRLVLRHRNVIRELDKRLDAVAWPVSGSCVISRFAVTGDRDRVLIEVAEDAGDWSWIEVRYPRPGSTLLVCGLGIIRHWEAGPTPRFLLTRLFERLTVKETLP